MAFVEAVEIRFVTVKPNVRPPKRPNYFARIELEAVAPSKVPHQVAPNRYDPRQADKIAKPHGLKTALWRNPQSRSGGETGDTIAVLTCSPRPASGANIPSQRKTNQGANPEHCYESPLAFSLAQVSLRDTVRLKTGTPSLESIGSTKKYPMRSN